MSELFETPELGVESTSNQFPPKVFIYERDIDLLLLEEFYTSSMFSKWFAEKVLNSVKEVETILDQIIVPLEDIPDLSDIKFVEARHSVTDLTGESDLTILYSTGDGRRWLVLVENKIAATFQKEQALRYLRRAKAAKSSKEVEWTTTVLVAPEKYFGNSKQKHGFQSRITYEQIVKEWFGVGANSGARGNYKCFLLKNAIEKAKNGGSNPIVMEFCRKYWLLARDRLPELRVPEPIKRTSTWTTIPLPGKASNISLVHKMDEGKMDLQFSNMAERLDELKTLYSVHLATGIEVWPAGKSGVLRLNVPILDVYQPFEEQTEEAYQGMVAALRLRHAYELVIQVTCDALKLGVN